MYAVIPVTIVLANFSIQVNPRVYNVEVITYCLLTEYAAGRCVANGDEAINSLYLSNAIYLSSWKNRKVALPVSGSRYELMFEKQFEKELEKKINKAIRRK